MRFISRMRTTAFALALAWVGAVYAQSISPVRQTVGSTQVWTTPVVAGATIRSIAAVAPGRAPEHQALTLSNPVGPAAGGNAWSVLDRQFLGARFRLTSPTRILSASGEFQYTNGTLFVAVVRLASVTSLPGGTTAIGTPFDTGQVVYSTTFSPVGPGYHSVALDVAVPAGVYGIVFGSGVLGATGSASMPKYESVTGSTGMFRTDSGTGSFLWTDSPYQFNINIVTDDGSARPVISATTAPRQVASLGQNLTLSATVSGATSYQWRRNGRPIAAATNASYVITSAAPVRDTGWYQLVATNTTGATTSPVVFVNVAVPNAQIVEWGTFVTTPPAPPADLGTITSVVVGVNRAAALKADGTVVAWGFNSSGESTPPAGLGDVVALSMGVGHTLALKADGTVVGWGDNSQGQATAPAGLVGVVAIAAGGSHNVVLKSDGTVVAWGWNTSGQATVPSGLVQVVGVSANLATSLALRADGTVAGWGANGSGETTPPAGLVNVATVVAGANHSIVVKTDGTLLAWGASSQGQLNIPAGLNDVVSLVAGDHNVALRADGTVVAWGYNGWGQTNIPAGLRDVLGLACSGTHNYAVRLPPPPLTLPTFTVQPVNASAISLQGFVTIQADASGNPVPTFQWQRQPAGTVGFSDVANSGVFSGTTTKTLTITAPAFSLNGDQFRCVATNSVGSVPSQVAALSVLEVPTFTLQPTNQNATAGQRVELSAQGAFSGPLNYRWRRNGYLIPGATTANFVIPAVTRADADNYDVFIFPTAGGTVTTSQTVAVRVAPTAYPTLVAPDPAWDVQPEADTAAVNTLVRLADGRAYVTGSFLRAGGQRRAGILRLTADGAVDSSFVPPEMDSTVTALAVQPDGKLLITGAFMRVDGVARIRLARLESDGRVDPGFNFGGAGPSSTPTAVAALSNGNIVLAGTFSTYNGSSVNRLTWLDSRGALIPDARNDPVGGATAPVGVLLALPGGKVAVGGNVTSSNSTVLGGLAVFRADGTLDPAFNLGAGGTVGSRITALAVQSDGKLVAGGTFTSFNGITRNRIVRLEASGAIDFSFDPGVGFSEFVRSIAIQPDGKMMVAAALLIFTSPLGSDLTRLTSTGARDPSFVPPAPVSSIQSISLQNDGKVLLGGSYTAIGSTTRDGLARLGVDGTLDNPFDLDLRGSGSIGAGALLPNGQVLLARSFGYLRGVAVPARVARFNADGTRDASFNAGGAGANDTVLDLVRLPDGTIVIAGSFTEYNGVAAGRLARLSATGSRDATYNAGGAGFDAPVNSIAHLTGGALVVGGQFSSFNGVARSAVALIEPTGNLVSGFAPTLNGFVNVVARAANGMVVVAGGFTNIDGRAANGLARLTSIGVMDSGFAVGTGPNNAISAVAVLPDNRLLVGGSFTAFNGVARSGLVRLNANGAVDPTFAPVITGGSVSSLHLQEDDKVIVRGTFTAVGGQAGTASLARINTDGTPDGTFASGGIVPSAVANTRLIMRDDGNLFVPGPTTIGLQVTRAATAPTISSQPVGATVAQGGSVTLAASATSAAPVVYQWWRNGQSLVGANSPTLTLTGVTPAQAGTYSLEVKSELGAVFSTSATLVVRSAPIIVAQFGNRSVGLGARTVFHVIVDALGTPTYVWRRNGVPIPGATASTFELASVALGDAGAYTVTVTDASGSILSAPGVLTVLPNPIAYSTRQVAAPPGVMAYFSIEGTEPKRLLLRAVGPTLATFAVTGLLADPRLTVLRANGSVANTNDNWGTNTGIDLPAAFAQVGAFALLAGSKDAVVLQTFSPGSYAVRVEGHNSTPGTALLELYDLDVNPQSRLAYVAVRGRVDPVAGSVFGGLTMANSAAKRLLLRAVGPTLGSPTGLANPQLQTLEGSTVVGSNDDWAGASPLIGAGTQGGAFALPTSSLDAALLIEQRIGTGAYTALVPQAAGSGEVLLEFYDLPSAGNSAVAPLVVQAPRAASAAIGAPLSLPALAIGASPLAYQWRRNGNVVAGATNATFAVSVTQASDAGLYELSATNWLGVATSASIPVSVGNSAVHVLSGPGYLAGGGTVTVTNILSYEGEASALGWGVVLPAGWRFISSSAAANGPAEGATGTLGWAWNVPPPTPVVFTYTLAVPAEATGPQTLTADAIIRVNEVVITPVALPASLVVPQIETHSADSNRDFEISLFELTRVIELYNTRNGTVRTGAYRVDAAGEDGFAADGPRAIGTAAVLTRYHSADTRGATTGAPPEGAIDLFELTRVIELYNTRAGTVRTGRYHVQSGTEDGFAAGP